MKMKKKTCKQVTLNLGIVLKHNQILFVDVLFFNLTHMLNNQIMTYSNYDEI